MGKWLLSNNYESFLFVYLSQSGLTQREIARRMGTTQSAVSRMTDPFYWNHSLSSLDRFAKAMGKTIELRYLEAA
jgi:antitoxin HicB